MSTSGPATALELAKDAFPNAGTDEYYQMWANGISVQLDKLPGSVIQKNDEVYVIVSSYLRYSLKIALGLT